MYANGTEKGLGAHPRERRARKTRMAVRCTIWAWAAPVPLLGNQWTKQWDGLDRGDEALLHRNAQWHTPPGHHFYSISFHREEKER